jgi:four helix bundle protein
LLKKSALECLHVGRDKIPSIEHKPPIPVQLDGRGVAGVEEKSHRGPIDPLDRAKPSPRCGLGASEASAISPVEPKPAHGRNVVATEDGRKARRAAPGRSRAGILRIRLGEAGHQQRSTGQQTSDGHLLARVASLRDEWTRKQKRARRATASERRATGRKSVTLSRPSRPTAGSARLADRQIPLVNNTAFAISGDGVENLDTWQQAVHLADTVYGLTRDFPAEERFGLTNQMCRAAVSVSANVAERASRSSRHDYARFVEIATGSLYVVVSQATVAHRQEFLTQPEEPITQSPTG